MIYLLLTQTHTHISAHKIILRTNKNDPEVEIVSEWMGVRR